MFDLCSIAFQVIENMLVLYRTKQHLYPGRLNIPNSVIFVSSHHQLILLCLYSFVKNSSIKGLSILKTEHSIALYIHTNPKQNQGYTSHSLPTGAAGGWLLCQGEWHKFWWWWLLIVNDNGCPRGCLLVILIKRW